MFGPRFTARAKTHHVGTSGLARFRLIALPILLLGSALVSAPAHALDMPALQWTAPASCPDVAHMKQRVAVWLRLKPDLGADEPASVQASGVVRESHPGSYTLQLTVTEGSASGTRTLSGTDCQQLSETAAFLIAVSIDPNAQPPVEGATAEPAQETSEPPASKLAEDVAAPAPPTPPPSDSAPSPWSLHASAQGGLWDAQLPGRSADFGGSVGFGYGPFLVEFRGSSALAHEQRVGSGTGRARSRTESYGVAGCALWGRRFRGGPCASLSLQVTRAHSQVMLPEPASRVLWGSFGLSAQGVIELLRQSAFALELFAELGGSAAVSARPSFQLDDSPVLTGSKLAYAGWLGLRFRWELSHTRRP